MKSINKKILAITLVIFLVALFTLTGLSGEEGVTLYFFWSQGCPYCSKEKPFLENLQDKFPSLKVVDKEISHDQENVELLQKMGKAYGREIRGVPTTFVGDQVWVGYNEKIGDKIEEGVRACLDNSCVDPILKVEGKHEKAEEPGPSRNESIEVPFLGRVDLNSMSAFMSTALIAFVDGFNPCSLWVLTFLLGLLIYTKSRKQIIIVGLTFLIITATAYGLFILGLFSAFQYIGQLLWIRVLVAVIAFAFGVVNVKDYFWFKEGFSFTIPEWVKPRIAERFRDLTRKGRSIPALVGATMLMALGVTLAELPCTAGFPVVWTGILNTQGVSGTTFAALFVIYMIIYLLDELLVFGTVSITLQSSKIQEEHGRKLKLVGGTLMLTLALSFLFAPELMNGLLGSLIVFGSALLGSLLLILVRKKLFPILGVEG